MDISSLKLLGSASAPDTVRLMKSVMRNLSKASLGVITTLAILSGCTGSVTDTRTAKPGYKLARFAGQGVFEIPANWKSDAPADGDTVELKILTPKQDVITAHLDENAEELVEATQIPDASKTGSSDVTINTTKFHKETFSGKDAKGAPALMSTYIGDSNRSSLKYVFLCYASTLGDLRQLEKIVENYKD
jgi:hypothetical protein